MNHAYVTSMCQHRHACEETGDANTVLVFAINRFHFVCVRVEACTYMIMNMFDSLHGLIIVLNVMTFLQFLLSRDYLRFLC
jgi:hypothetical protein